MLTDAALMYYEGGKSKSSKCSASAKTLGKTLFKLRAESMEEAEAWKRDLDMNSTAPPVLATRIGLELRVATSKSKEKKGRKKEDPEMRNRIVGCCKGIEAKMRARAAAIIWVGKRCSLFVVHC